MSSDEKNTRDEQAVNAGPAGPETTERLGEQPGARTVSADAEGLSLGAASAPEVVAVGQGEREPTAASEPAPDEAAPDAVEAAADEGDFAALLAESERAGGDRGGFQPGDRVEGTVEVISLHGQEVFLDLGGKATGYILKEELRDDEGNLTVAQGDRIEGVVVGTDSNGVRIRRTLARVGGDLRALREAADAGIPVEGKIVGTNKGGYDVLVAGGRGFCPHSQIDLYRIEDPESMVGRTFTFKVTEIRGGTPVLSRAAVLKAEQAEKAAEVREKLQPGARMTGIVRSIQKYGAFVDLGGVDGLVHVSELSWSRVDDPHEVVQLGQEVEVVVLELDQKRDRVALSLRKAQKDPYEEAVEGLQIGQTVEGTVARLTNFGAFVTIAPEVDGLIHISDMAHHRVRSPKDILSVGDRVEAKITEIDLERRRIGLSLKAMAADPWEDIESRYKVDQTVTGKVVSVQPFGVFVDLEPGVTALLPASETGTGVGENLRAHFKPGAEIEVRVLRIEPGDKKMAVTRRPEGEAGDAGRRAPGGDRRGPPRGERGDRGERGGPRGDRGDRGDRGSRGGPRVWLDEGAEDKGKDKGQRVGSFGELLLQALKKDGEK